ncbi:MAG: Tol-Pal system beta propeller repeat protein TolB [Gammaproteobacteria bacterium]|nr:Tol-Pal system beta propeller repeat protein TolB [Gammaproteobacteria bacterium]
MVNFRTEFKNFLWLVFASVLFLLLVPVVVWGQEQPLDIIITEGVEGAIPVAVVPFESSAAGDPPQIISDIIEADLARSGRFETVPREDFLGQPTTFNEVRFKDWRLLKVDAVVVGKVSAAGGGQYDVQFELVDVFEGRQMTGWRYRVDGGKMRKVAHQIADIIYKQLTGIDGAFDTRIAYVTVQKTASGGANYLLQVADSDGYGPSTALTSSQPILSPAWSPDGSRLAYVSFEGRKPKIFVQNVADGRRVKLADYSGINSAPAWSPDGSRIAMTLSKDGNPEIYVADSSGGNLRRLTKHGAIDTEPAWSPDGQTIVFTSGRSGNAQIYRMNAGGGGVSRVTFDGKYNARASFSPDGNQLVMITQRGRGYQVGLLDMRTNATKVLSDSRLDESPSFAPNGAMIIFGTQSGGRGVLAAVSSDGRASQILKFQEGAVREPAWSPFNRKL